MASAIDSTKPVALRPTTASVRANFAAAKAEIEALQSAVTATAYDAKTLFGAKGNGINDDTLALQTAIDTAFAAGGGEVFLPPGVYKVSGTAATDVFWNIPASEVANTVTAAATTCLVLRSGVRLVGAGLTATVIQNADPTRTVISPVDMIGGGIEHLTIDGGWTSAGAGHGVLLVITAVGKYNRDLLFSHLEIRNTGSYGIGAQYGSYYNNRYEHLHIHHTGADGIDHKVRDGTANPVSRGVTFDHILVENFNQRSGITASAGLDARGPVQVNNFTARNFGNASSTLVGIRLSAATAHSDDIRESSHYSSVSNFLIEGSTTYATSGVVFLSSEGSSVSNGYVRDCTAYGVDASNSSSGSPTTAYSKISSVVVEGSRGGSAFRVGGDHVTLANCTARGATTRFSSNQGNLIAGQTVFTVAHDAANLAVYKNDVLLTVTTDYTANGTAVTLTSGVLVTDIIHVITKTTIAFEVTGAYATMVACEAPDAVTPISISSTPLSTFQSIGNRLNANWISVRSAAAGSNPYLEAVGTDAAPDLELRGKSTGGVTLRSNANRAFRAANASASAVNWLQAAGSATGVAVSLTAQGSDTNVQANLAGKGTGGTQIETSASGKVGFLGTAPVTKPTISGSRGGNAALQSLLTALAAYGLITDTTST